MSKKPVFGSPFEEIISVPQLHRVKGETLVVGGLELSDCIFLVFIILVFQLAKPRLKDFE